uniref:protein WVD2-like 7 n=1 Tax=Erigeron canadensis TaxID=72917 RepID=UPI001CB8A1BC|nr:protein WVD2-like 7 [Erigeron canadensis]
MMGESMVETQHPSIIMDNNNNNKIEIGESPSSSVSFGKYENEGICWERWSAFASPNNNNNNSNKYLDEVGKCSTPGSVAQKKAFFEAHYKKIAEMKKQQQQAEEQEANDRSLLLADQHQSPHPPPPSTSDHPNCQQLKHEISTEDESVKLQHETRSSNDMSHSSQEAATASVDHQTFQGESCTAPKPQHLSPLTLNNNAPIYPKEQEEGEEAVLVNNQNLKDESCDTSEPHGLLSSQSAIPTNRNGDKLEDALLVNNQSMKLVKQHFQVEPDAEFPRQSNQQVPKPKPQNVARKVKPTKVESNLVGRTTKPASMMSKSPETLSTKLSKPKAATTPITTSRSSLNKEIASLSSKSKNHSVLESRRIASTSLHLSMSMSSVHSDTASSVTSSRRRSMFLEQMGDKDIVKRAFKTFQNRYNQLPSSDGRSTEAKQIPTKGSGQKALTSTVSQKENERSRKAAEKTYHARGQIGPTWKSVSSGSFKGVGVDERRLKTTPTSVVLRSNERAERRKEFFKNLEEKSNARDAERTQLSSKSKEAKDAEIKKLRQNLTFKAKPMPSFYRAQGLSKSTSEKGTIKNETTRRPDSHR